MYEVGDSVIWQQREGQVFSVLPENCYGVIMCHGSHILALEEEELRPNPREPVWRYFTGHGWLTEKFVQEQLSRLAQEITIWEQRLDLIKEWQKEKSK